MTIHISVIMAVYNGEKTVCAAIDSVLAQTYPDFEMVVVDDASTDGTPAALERYAVNPRVVLLRNERNLERSLSRNRAIERARGEFIAVLDADDVCLPDRLERQAAYLQAHPEVDVLGGRMQYIDDEGSPLRLSHPPAQGHALIAWQNLFSTPLAHSTVIVRAAKLRLVGGYDPRWPPCEDADLWIRLLKAGARFANLPEALVQYRKNARQQAGFIQSLPLSWEIRRQYMEELLGRPVTIAVYKRLFLSLAPNLGVTMEDGQLIEALELLFGAYQAMQQRGCFFQDDLAPVQQYLLERMTSLVNHNPGTSGEIAWMFFKRLPTRQWLRLWWRSKRFPLKSALHRLDR